jgi:hypothetical protein
MTRWIEIAALAAGGLLVVFWQLFNGPLTALVGKDTLLGVLFILFAGALIHREILERVYLKRILEKTSPEFEKCLSIPEALSRVTRGGKAFNEIRIWAVDSGNTQPMFENEGIRSKKLSLLLWSPPAERVDAAFKDRHDGAIVKFSEAWKAAHEKLGLFKSLPKIGVQSERPQFYYYIFAAKAVVIGPLLQISGPGLSYRTPFVLWANSEGSRQFIFDLITQFDGAIESAPDVSTVYPKSPEGPARPAR